MADQLLVTTNIPQEQKEKAFPLIHKLWVDTKKVLDEHEKSLQPVPPDALVPFIAQVAALAPLTHHADCKCQQQDLLIFSATHGDKVGDAKGTVHICVDNQARLWLVDLPYLDNSPFPLHIRAAMLQSLRMRALADDEAVSITPEIFAEKGVPIVDVVKSIHQVAHLLSIAHEGTQPQPSMAS